MAPVAALLALLVLSEAKPLAPPGHHAPPPIANMLSKSKRAMHNLVTRYYGDIHGMHRPPPLIEKRGTAIVPVGWTDLGCVAESYPTRLLGDYGFYSESVDPLFCLNHCQAKGYIYGGVEFGDECYCANSLTGNGGQAATDCNTPCAGDSTQMCGNQWSLNLFQYSNTSGQTCTPAGNGTYNALPWQLAQSQINATATTTSPLQSATTTSATASAPSSSHSSYTDLIDASEWYALGCAVDSESSRILSGYSLLYQPGLSVDNCLTTCEDKGFTFAGVEYGQECYCGSTVPSTITYTDGACTMPCTGNAQEMCGGELALDLYELISSASGCPANSTTSDNSTIGNIALVSAKASASATSAATTTNAVAPGTTATQMTTTTAAAAASATVSPASGGTAVAASSTNVPASSDTHSVWAHHMVGNTYPYGVNDWLNDINLAHSQGIDGFALNMGIDSWQPDRVNDAYTAAAQSGTGFKLFLSLDMTSLTCNSPSDAQNLVSLVQAHAGSSAQAMHDGKVLVSTFAGSDCGFGGGNWQSSFVTPLNNAGIQIFFAPSFFSSPSTFSGLSYMDADFNWNSGWPMGGTDLDTSSDTQHMAALSSSQEYMAAVSPFFFTHYGADSWNKNWLYRSDDWLYCTRWEALISMRQQIKQVEILTWNDYGESSYIGPIEGAMPGDAAQWVNGFDHTKLSALTNYYATAYKTGSYPAISNDQILLWSRPHQHDAQACCDSAGQPSGTQNTQDYLWSVVLATAPATVTLTSGSNTQTFSVNAGLTKLQIPNSSGGISGSISRNGNTVASANGGSFSWTTTPQTYNFNYIVVSS